MLQIGFILRKFYNNFFQYCDWARGYSVRSNKPGGDKRLSSLQNVQNFFGAHLPSNAMSTINTLTENSH